MMINSWIWLILAVLFGVIEIITLSLTTCWFVIGALCALIASYFNASWEFQIIIFTATSVLLLLFVRPVAQSHFKIGAVKSGSPALIGEVGIVQERIAHPLYGLVTINGQIWTAESLTAEPIEVGEKVEITQIEGVILRVRKIIENI